MLLGINPSRRIARFYPDCEKRRHHQSSTPTYRKTEEYGRSCRTPQIFGNSLLVGSVVCMGLAHGPVSRLWTRSMYQYSILWILVTAYCPLPWSNMGGTVLEGQFRRLSRSAYLKGQAQDRRHFLFRCKWPRMEQLLCECSRNRCGRQLVWGSEQRVLDMEGAQGNEAGAYVHWGRVSRKNDTT